MEYFTLELEESPVVSPCSSSKKQKRIRKFRERIRKGSRYTQD